MQRALFIGTNNETLSIATMRVCNPACSTIGNQRPITT